MNWKAWARATAIRCVDNISENLRMAKLKGAYI